MSYLNQIGIICNGCLADKMKEALDGGTIHPSNFGPLKDGDGAWFYKWDWVEWSSDSEESQLVMNILAEGDDEDIWWGDYAFLRIGEELWDCERKFSSDLAVEEWDDLLQFEVDVCAPAIEKAKGSSLEISRILTISTVHLTKATLAILDEIAADPISARPDIPITAYGKGPYGYLVYCGMVGDDEESDRAIPEDLFAAMQLAHENSCEFLNVDSDGPIVESLHDYQIEKAEDSGRIGRLE